MHDLQNSLLADYAGSPTFNGIRPHFGNGTVIDENRHGAMEHSCIGGFEEVPSPYAHLPWSSDANTYYHATLADRSLPIYMDRYQQSNDPWMSSPHGYYYEEVENRAIHHYALDNVTPPERWGSTLFPGEYHDGLTYSATDFANDYATRGYGSCRERASFRSNVQYEMVYGDEITGSKYPCDFNHSETAVDHISRACYPSSDPVASTDPQTCKSTLPVHRPHSPVFTPSLHKRCSIMNKKLKRHVQWLLKATFLVHKKRMDLNREEAILHRKKQDLNDQWRDLQRERDRNMPRQKNRRRDSFNEYDFNAFDRDSESGSDSFTHEEDRYNRTRNEKTKSRCHVSFDVEDDIRDGYSSQDNLVSHEEYGSQYPYQPLPSLSRAVIDEAQARLQIYNSAWSTIISPAEAISAQIPYPSSTLRPEDLLRPSPSYLRFLMLAPEHSSAHIRIQFHALAFYLHPFGLQPRLVPLPPQEEKEKPDRETQGPLEVIGLVDAERNTLEQIKVMMDSEVVKWHEDKLRLRGFSKMLDDEGLVVLKDGLLEDDLYTSREWRPRRRKYREAYGTDTCKNIKGKDLVHGVWAAVDLLRGLVRQEVKERREATMI